MGAAFVAPGTGGGGPAKQVPGFLVFFVTGSGAVRREQDVGLSVGGGRGQDVPEIQFDDVGGDEVEAVAGVGNAAGSDVALIRTSALVLGAFDLDAQEVSVVLDGEVVRGHVSPGAADAEAEFGGAGHEAHFGPLAPQLGVLDVDTTIGHEISGKRKSATREESRLKLLLPDSL